MNILLLDKDKSDRFHNLRKNPHLKQKQTQEKIINRLDEFLLRAPTWDVFSNFITSIINGLKDPPLIFNIDDFLDDSVMTYVNAYPLPQQPTTGVTEWKNEPLPQTPLPQIITMGTSSVNSSPNLVSGGQAMDDWDSIVNQFLKKTGMPLGAKVSKGPVETTSDQTKEITISIAPSKGEAKKFVLHYHPNPLNNNFLHFKADREAETNYKINWNHWVLTRAGITQGTFEAKK